MNMHRNARFYGVPFARRASFSCPRHVGQGQPLHYPTDAGTKFDCAAIFIEDAYRMREINRPQEIQTVLDIGANVGLASVAARLSFPTAEIHAYEPDRTLSGFLDANAAEFCFESKYVAVGSAAGRVQLIRDAFANQNRTRNDGQGEIPQISLDSAIDELLGSTQPTAIIPRSGSVDFLKMDCEGAEWEILGQVPAWSRVARVAMEYHNFDGQDHAAIPRALQNAGLRVLDQRFLTEANYGMIYAINPELVKHW